MLANPQLRTQVGIAAQARFGERVPVPVTTFSPIATGGVQQQPITSFNYENIGVNIDITPRTHMDNDVTLALTISVTSISGTGFGGLPTFGNRLIKTQIRLKDGETNMLAGLIRDDERKSPRRDSRAERSSRLSAHLFGHSQQRAQQTDVILMLTPHIVRVLDLDEEDLRPFQMGRDSGASAPASAMPRRRSAAGQSAPGRRSLQVRRSTGAARPSAAAHQRHAAPASGAARRPRCGRRQAARPVIASRRADLLNLRAQHLEPLDQLAVAALDGLERAQAALPFGRQARGNQRHSRTQIAAVELPSPQLARPGHDDPVRIAQKQIGPHAAELLQREQAQLVHPVVNQRPALGLRGEHRDEADEIAREARPQARS